MLIAIGIAILMAFLATRRRFGRYVYSIGGNPEAAVLAGINTRWTIMKTFIVMGVLAAIAAVIITARLNAATSALGTGAELQVIAAAVIGGTSFAGGIGTIAGGVLGAVVMQSLSTGMTLIGVENSHARTWSLGSCSLSRSGSTPGFGGAGREWRGHEHGDRRSHRPSPAGSPAPPLVEMRNIRVSFGGVHAVNNVTVDLHAGEVVGLVGGNGAGKSTLIRALSGAHPPDDGEIYINGEKASIANPHDARNYGIETIYQTLALADNVDAAANLFLGRELTTRLGSLNDAAMESATREVMGRLNPKFKNFKVPVASLSGGQRQSVAIARAVHFNARILIMDEPTAALGPAETEQVRELVAELKAQGIGIFLISHDIHDVFDLADRISVMLQGKLVGTVDKNKVTKDEVLAMIIIGKLPEQVSEKEMAELIS